MTGPQWLAFLGLALVTPVLVEAEKWVRRRRGRQVPTELDVPTAVSPARAAGSASAGPI